MSATSQRAVVDVHSWLDWPRWANAWAELAQTSPHTSFFLTADWTGTWLRIFGEQLQPRLLVFSIPGETDPAGMCLLTFRIEKRGPFRVTRVYLNAAGEDEPDDTCIEYNALLCREGYEAAVAESLAAYLREQPWEELSLHGMTGGTVLAAIEAASFRAAPIHRREAATYYVPLHSLDGSPDTYVKSLSKNTREQVRRSSRLYAERGPLELQAAADPESARRALAELGQLHQAAWTARGKSGMFGSARFVAFHRAILETVFPAQGVQLLRIGCGGEVLAVLYNFVYRGRVYFYQSGIRYEEDNRLKPGLVAHVLAVEHCRAQGLLEYDFLAGDSQYKKSLSTASRSLVWLTYQRPSVKFKAIALLRSAKQRLTRLRHGDRPAK